VKRILEHLGLQVNRLIRLSFGPFQLGDLESGLVEEVKTKVLRDQLGAKLAAEAGVDFESPVREPIAPFGSPKKAERPERRDREDRYEERPRRPRDGERAFRDRDERPAHGRRDDEGEAARTRPSRLEPKRSVWRAGEDEAAERPHRKGPRRGADPREARAASAERPRQRVGAIASPEGRKVVVERLVSQPREEERPARRPRGEGRPAPAGDDRPRRRGPAPDDRREARGPREDRAPRTRGRDERPPRREGGDRPFRSRDGDRPERGGEARPRRGPPRGDAPPRGGPRGGFKGGGKGGPRGGAKGGFKGGPKGPPRGRRP
jgi:23S rRNA pseudouridine2605 synthase